MSSERVACRGVPMQVCELLAFRVETMLAAPVGEAQVDVGDLTHRVVAKILGKDRQDDARADQKERTYVDEAFGDILDYGGTVQLERRLRFVQAGRRDLSRDQLGKCDDLIRISVKICVAVGDQGMNAIGGGEIRGKLPPPPIIDVTERSPFVESTRQFAQEVKRASSSGVTFPTAWRIRMSPGSITGLLVTRMRPDRYCTRLGRSGKRRQA